MSRTETPTERPPSFREEATEVLGRLQRKFAEVLAAVPSPISKAADLQRALRLDQKLSGKLYKAANCLDPLEAGSYVPGPSNMKTFFRAAAKRGVPKQLLEEASRVVEEFDRLVATHADDRATFDSMVGSLTADGSRNQITLQHRRDAFRAQRQIWGVQTKTQLMTHLLQPAEDPAMLDIAVFEGCLSLRRVRNEAPLMISRVGMVREDGDVQDNVRVPLDPHGQGTHGIGLLHDFCTKPLPEFRTLKAEGGFVRCELLTGGLGNRAAVTCIEGHIARNAAPSYGREQDSDSAVAAMVEMPCEVIILDMLVREGTLRTIRPVADIRAVHPGLGIWIQARPLEELRHLPLHVPVAYLGKGPMALRTTDVPRYTEMASYAFDQLGWDRERFEAYRCRVEYPVMPSVVAITFSLHEAPTP